MGIQVEFNPGLALRDLDEYRAGRRAIEECVPEKIVPGEIYSFLKEGQRNFWLLGEVPLSITKGNGDLSRPVASIVILNPTHTNYNKLKKIEKKCYLHTFL